MLRKDREKYFCVGLNKTGTTSIAKAFRDLSYKVDDESSAHQLLFAYEKRDFKSIAKHAKKAQVFQDAPWSYHFTFLHMHQAFPDAKFILTERNSEEEWYQSLTRFHANRFGKDGEMPTSDELKAAKRPHGRSVYQNLKSRFNTPDEDIYNKEILIRYYLDHNRMVKDYFRHIPEQLLVINLAEEHAYARFCEFLGVKSVEGQFPWLNRSKT